MTHYLFTMQYISTRGGIAPVGFRDAVMMGMADDGGLLLPSEIPDVSDKLDDWRGLSYAELAVQVMLPFVDLSEDDLAGLVNRSYCTFAHPEVTPLVPVGDLHILELFHGPTLAFKDVALQFLGNLFEDTLSRSGRQLNILAATSGDTGSAAISGVYASRVAGGDIYYSPLVKNPAGGETLALYFGFDEDSMSPRTRRQLDIVASMLKSDPAKKITLSGHTDSLGTKEYNDGLSANRAKVVRDFLAEAGVSAQQIIVIAKGASQPRRPNITESGEDNPEGRRANRRTEIYLDF